MNPTYRLRLGAIALVLLGTPALMPASLRAQQDTSSAPVTLNGFVAASYSYNINRPLGALNALRVFDFDDGTFKLDVAEIVVQRTTPHPGDAGFRIDATMGGSIPRITAARGLFRADDGTAGDIDLQQAYISYALPVSASVRVDAGKFVTPLGYELIEGYDGYNDNATRSFLFGYAIPFTHTGVRLTCVANEEFTTTVMAVNGWDVAKDNNRTKTACIQMLLTPGDGLTFALAYIGGAERDSSSDLRQVFDLVGQWKYGDDFSLGLNADYGTEKNAVIAGKSSVWRGAALYAKLALSNTFTLAMRGEYFEDRDGARTGAGQILREITLTPEYHPTPGIAFRADLRADVSSLEAFEKDNGTSRWQPTVLVGGLYTF
jgi:hypothetical protein